MCIKPMNISCAIKESLIRANREERIVAGVYSAVKHLQINPEMIMLCLIMDADPGEDVSVHIQHTLIEAYCLEHDIYFLKVSNLNKIADILEFTNDHPKNSRTDYNCILVQHPHPSNRSALDDFISDYCDRSLMAEDVFQTPVIELPI